MLFHELKELRQLKDVYNGYYRVNSGFVVRNAMLLRNLIRMGIITDSFLDTYQCTQEDWILLVQIYSPNYKTLHDSMLMLSSIPEPSPQQIAEFLSKQGVAGPLKRLDLNRHYRKVFQIAPIPFKTITDSIVGLEMFLRSPASRCAHCGTSLDWPGSRDAPCTKNSCRAAHCGISGVYLRKEIESDPVVTDLLISLAYEAASVHQISPYPEGVGKFRLKLGYFKDGIFVGFPNDRKVGCKLLVDTIDKIPPIDQILRKAGSNLDDYLNSIDGLIAPLLKWILRSNYALLEHLDDTSSQVTGLDGLLQFKMQTANPANEK